MTREKKSDEEGKKKQRKGIREDVILCSLERNLKSRRVATFPYVLKVLEFVKPSGRLKDAAA
jgi:hypothetical protein